MNITDYKNKKNKGLIKIVKINDAYAFIIKKFNLETGREIEPDIESIDLDELIKEKNSYQIKVTDYIGLIKDVKKCHQV